MADPTIATVAAHLLAGLDKVSESVRQADFSDPAVTRAALDASMQLHRNTLIMVKAIAAAIDARLLD